MGPVFRPGSTRGPDVNALGPEAGGIVNAGPVATPPVVNGTDPVGKRIGVRAPAFSVRVVPTGWVAGAGRLTLAGSGGAGGIASAGIAAAGIAAAVALPGASAPPLLLSPLEIVSASFCSTRSVRSVVWLK